MWTRIVLLGLSFLVFGCGGASAPEVAVPTPDPEPAAAAAPETTEAPEALAADTLAALAKADAVDGDLDNVVSKCALCSLHMDGSPDHVVTAGDYSLHMCSAECKSHYEEDMQGSLAKLADAVK